MIGRDIADDDAIHGDRDGDERGVNECQAANPPDPEGLEDGQKDGRELMQESDGANDHGIYILPLRRMLGAPGEKIEGVGKQREDGAQRGFGTLGAAGEVENQGVSGGDADAAAEGGKGSLVGAVLANELGKARNKPGGDREGGFGRDVAQSQAGAPGGEDEAGARRSGAKCRGKLIELVGEGDGFDDLRAGGG